MKDSYNSSKAQLRFHPMALAVALTIVGTATSHAAELETTPAADAPVQQIEVTGIRASKQKSLEKKRNADGVTEVISAEDVGKMPDKNVADALQKLPGVVTTAGSGGGNGYDENDRVSMRGTSPSLALTTINGHSVATADWDPSDMLSNGGASRSVSFLLLPSEIVSQVIVHKSAQADQLEGGVSGAIDILTRRPLEFKKPFTAEIGLQGVYSDLSGKTNPQLNALFNWKNETGNAGVMLQVFDQKRQIRRDSQQMTWGVISPTSAAGKANGGQLAGAYYASGITQQLFQQERHRSGAVVDAEFKVNNDLTLNLNGFHSKLKAEYLMNNFVVRPGNSIAGGVVPTNVALSNGVLTNARFDNTGNATGAQIETYSNPSAASQTNFLNGDFKYRASENLRFTGQVGKTKADSDAYLYANYAFLPNTSTGYSYSGAGSTLQLSLPNGVNAANLTANPGNSGADDSYALQHSADKESYGNVDGEYRFEDSWLSAIKAGVRHSDHERAGTRPLKGGPAVNAANNGATAITTLPGYGGTVYPGDFGNNLGGVGTGGLPLLTSDQVVSWSNANLPTNPSYNLPVSGVFKVKEKVDSGYLMARFEGEHWRGDVGLRLVRTKVSVTTNTGVPCGVPSATNGITYGSPAQASACAAFVPAGATLTTGSRFGNFYTMTTDSSYTNKLPSANLALDVREDVVVRLSAAKVMSRPDYSALGATFSGFAYNVANPVPSTATGGNPKLAPVVAKNYNAGVEWYFKPRSLLSAQLFYIDFESLIGSGTSTQVLLNTAIPASLGGPALVPTVVNSPVSTKGVSKGIELGYEQPVWGSFGVQANYSYVDAKEANGLPMLGSSKNAYTAGAYFENDQFSARLVYSYRSASRNGLFGLSQSYSAGTGTLAASVNYIVSDKLTLTFEGLNLNNPKLRVYNAASATIPFENSSAFYSSGRQFYLGLRYKF